MATYSVNWSAVLSSTSGSVAIGQCLVMATDGTHYVATTANRATYGRAVGLAATTGDITTPVVQMIEVGIVPATITGLAVGSVSWVRVSSTGTLERVTPGSGDDIVGQAHADGSVQINFGLFDSTNYAGGGGSFTAPTGTGLMTTTSGAMDAASAPYGAGFLTWVATPSSANLATLTTDETGTGALVFGTAPLFKTTINLNNPGNTFKYVITPGAILADRILNLPVLAATDTVAVLDFAQTLTNKTIVAASNTITDTSAAEGDILVHNGTRFVRLAKGTSTYVLTAGASTVSWAAPAAASGTVGVFVQAMADANQTPSSGDVSAYHTIRTTGANSADRDLVLPAASDAAAYQRVIVNACTDSGGQFAIRIKDSGAGTVVYVPNGCTKTIRMDAGGASHVGAKYDSPSGQSTLAVTGGHVLTQSFYERPIWRFTGSSAGTNDITIPNPAAGESYVKYIRNSCTAGSLKFTTGAGTTGTLAEDVSGTQAGIIIVTNSHVMARIL